MRRWELTGNIRLSPIFALPGIVMWWTYFVTPSKHLDKDAAIYISFGMLILFILGVTFSIVTLLRPGSLGLKIFIVVANLSYPLFAAVQMAPYIHLR